MDPAPLNHALSAYKASAAVRLHREGAPPGTGTGTATALELDGNRLDIPAVVAIARHGQVHALITPDPAVRDLVKQSIDTLTEYLARGWTVYGVNTGYGGSADARSDQLARLQLSALQHTQSAIITSHDKAGTFDSHGASHVVPAGWVRASMLVRANQNLRGHSAVRLEVIERLLDLVNLSITPLVPLRGTISASGDLMPLSYIAGAIAGLPDIFVRLPDPNHATQSIVLEAREALRRLDMSPIKLGPKEGLGLINGTAPSAALASLVLYEAQQLAVLAQALTAFAAECFAGNVEWADEFVHAVRPHPGQIEVASNIRAFLKGSDFVQGLKNRTRSRQGLWQDRYSTRTAPQWLGPYLEDLMLAQRQIETELNSTSDNPLVQASSHPETAGEVFSGGNFQAAAVTSAMDKTRQALVMVGRLLFSQCGELVDPTRNNGLDANLAWGDHDVSFTMKGVDVNCAAYMAELASLAHPVSAHVLPAEMGNQGVNSMAFVTARRTMEAVDLVAHLAAAHLALCCQAVELRAFTDSLGHQLSASLADGIGKLVVPQNITSDDVAKLQESWIQFWTANNTIPWPQRCDVVVTLMEPVIEAWTVGRIAKDQAVDVDAKLRRVTQDFRSSMPSIVAALAKSANKHTDGSWLLLQKSRLGAGSGELYQFVRRTLAVPTSRGLDDLLLSTEETPRKAIGSGIGAIYEAIRDGSLFDATIAKLVSEAA